MNTVDRLQRAFDNPRLFIRGINRMYHRRGGFRKENVDGIDVFSEDWDNLVVLDGCRYDMFKNNNRIKGHLSAKRSKGSATTEWLRANFTDRDLTDTVYVTANPQLERHRSDWDVRLHNTVNVWLNEGWDETTGTVLAETVNESALDAITRFPNKRLVVHYMQPHYPFVQSDTTFDKEHLSSISNSTSESTGENVWGQKFAGELSISSERLWSMYVDNLKYVLEHVEGLLNELAGKSVVTSDHGNYVGERASPLPIHEYGHPRGLYDDTLVRVPWLECESNNRRDIIAAQSEYSSESVESAVISNRLRDLGYLE